MGTLASMAGEKVHTRTIESRRSGAAVSGRVAATESFLKDSCHAWREEGAAFQALRKTARNELS